MVYYDGLATDRVNLEDLRSGITIIPQVVRLHKCFALNLSADCLDKARTPEWYAENQCSSTQPAHFTIGTLRRNLDPFDQNDDLTLNNALRAAGLFSLQSESEEARLTLDSAIGNGGNNLSVGQRQIIALARAIVRNCKLLILDEGKQ